MKNNLHYMNVATMELTEDHRTAVEWFREGFDINLYTYDTNKEMWNKRLAWVH